jgi:hypothetical protein
MCGTERKHEEPAFSAIGCAFLPPSIAKRERIGNNETALGFYDDYVIN